MQEACFLSSLRCSCFNADFVDRTEASSVTLLPPLKNMGAHLNRNIIFLGCVKDGSRIEFSDIEDRVESNFKELQ